MLYVLVPIRAKSLAPPLKPHTNCTHVPSSEQLTTTEQRCLQQSLCWSGTLYQNRIDLSSTEFRSSLQNQLIWVSWTHHSWRANGRTLSDKKLAMSICIAQALWNPICAWLANSTVLPHGSNVTSNLPCWQNNMWMAVVLHHCMALERGSSTPARAKCLLSIEQLHMLDNTYSVLTKPVTKGDKNIHVWIRCLCGLLAKYAPL